jgi:glycosyltransferase involved in cell wall biosynthesis
VKRLSVIIANYNYERYVGQAIESALALDWPDVEVVVIDDGSTDGSRSVIGRFADRVTVIEQENSRQRVAHNRGLAASTGDVVVFLDSDDVLHPSLPREISLVWHQGVSKVQCQVERIGASGRPLGSVVPELRRSPGPAEIRHWIDTTTAYPTPPCSGNAYARDFLEQIFPLDESCDDFSDSACLVAAPYFGDVVTIARPLVGYRVHETNDSDLLADPSRFAREVERALWRHRYAHRVAAERGAPEDERLLFRGRFLLQLRVASLRLQGGATPLPGDGRLRMLRDAVVSPFVPGPEGPRKRVLVAIWCITVLLSPARLVPRLVAARFGRGR